MDSDRELEADSAVFVHTTNDSFNIEDDKIDSTRSMTQGGNVISNVRDKNITKSDHASTKSNSKDAINLPSSSTVDFTEKAGTDYSSSSTDHNGVETDTCDDVFFHPEGRHVDTDSLVPAVSIARSESSVEGVAVPLTKLYPSRYWVLILYSLIMFFQAMIWNTWGAITESAFYAFDGWDPTTIAGLSSWGSVGIFLFVVPASWCIGKYGMRPVVLCLLFSCVIGHLVRSLTVESTYFLISAHICAAFNGILGTIILSSALIPALWFPAEHRVTACAFANVVNQMGAGGSFLEPLIVRSPNVSNVTVNEVRSDIQNLMYIDLGIFVGLFVCVLAYFPSKPPLPPTNSSTVPRYQFIDGLKTIVKSVPFWLITMSYVIFQSTSSNWITVIAVSLHQFGFNQQEVGMLGIYIALTVGVVSLISAWLADFFYGKLKMGLLVIMLLSSVIYLWFMLMSLDILPSSKVMVYIAVLGGQSFNFAATPFFIELLCESVYPASENVANTIGVLLFNFVASLFFFVFFLPNFDPQWVTYILVASNFSMIIPVIFFKEEYKRSRLDRNNI